MKEEILKQIKVEARMAASDKQAALDAKYFAAVARGEKAVRETYTPPDFETELAERLRRLSGLPTSNPTGNTIPEFEKIFETLEKYIAAFPTPKNLIFIGGTGTGKTYASRVVGGKLLDMGFSVLYITAFSLVQRFKDYIFNFESSALDHLLTCDLLIIDDLGTEPKIKNISDENLLNVINERQAQEKPFIITTNLSPSDILARYDQRLASRILSKETSVIINMKGPDLRLS
jgi:DNA replication protein DnaC